MFHLAPRKRTPARKKWGRAEPTCSHNVFTHFLRDPNCIICQKSKTTKARCGRKTEEKEKPDSLPKPSAFGQFISADHAIFNEGFESRKHDTVALIIQDSYAYWLQAYPAKHKKHKRSKPMESGTRSRRARRRATRLRRLRY